MPLDAFNHLTGLKVLKNRLRLPEAGGAAKLPLSADFAGPFTQT
jgi:hypothetical protein